MGEAKSLYEEDLLLWSKEQAEALRAAARGGSNQALDWENLAEEIEDLGSSQRSALASQLRRIIQHLLKLEFSPASDPRRGWEESIGDARAAIEDLLETSPSLKAEIAREIERQTRRAIKLTVQDLHGFGEIDEAAANQLRQTRYTEEQVLGDWFPPG